MKLLPVTTTKILLDGFHVDTVETKGSLYCATLKGYERFALTDKVKSIIEEENRTVVSIVPIMSAEPRLILINTEFMPSTVA